MERTKIILNSQTQDTVNFELVGQIDEDFNADEILNNKKNIMTFDFSKIVMINSCGVREWINLLEKLSSNKVIYKNCPQIVIEQINMVHGFVGENSKIESFYAPYFSEKKDQVVKVLINSSQVVNGKAPQIEDDGEILEFDAIEAQYFQFLKHKG